MDDIRKGQIALAYIKNKIRKEGIHLMPNLQLQAGDTAKDIGISTEEAMEFAEGILHELVEEAFRKPDKRG